MLYRRPRLSGALMLTTATILGITSGILFVNGIFAALEKPLNALYRAHNH